jgi:hypothetical protein
MSFGGFGWTSVKGESVKSDLKTSGWLKEKGQPIGSNDIKDSGWFKEHGKGFGGNGLKSGW